MRNLCLFSGPMRSRHNLNLNLRTNQYN